MTGSGIVQTGTSAGSFTHAGPSGSAGLRLGDPDRPEHFAGFAYRLLLTARLLAVGAVGTGAAVLVGYLSRTAFLIRLLPGLPPMYPNAAIGFIAGGIGVLGATSGVRRRRPVAVVGALVIGGIGAVSLVGHLVQAGSTWFEGLWPDDPVVAATTRVAGRPAAETCIAFVLLGAAVALMALRRAPRAGQALGLGALTVGAAAVFGYVIGVDRTTLGSSLVGVGMALHTGIGIALLGTAVLLTRPTIGIVGSLTSAGPGGRLGRRLVIAVVAAPLVLSAIAVWFVRIVPDEALARSFVTVVQVAALGALAMVPAAAIDELDRAAAQARRDARQVAETTRARDEVRRTIGAELLASATSPPGWHVAIRQEPAFGMLAGDAVQVLHDDERMLVALIDVAGHGTGPALQAYRLRVELAALWGRHASLEDLVTRLDGTLVDLGTIATGVFVDIDVRTGRARYVNAGHPAPAQVSDGKVLAWERTGPLIGLGHGARGVGEATLHKGDLFVAFTDGLSEARHERGPQLGDEVVRRLIGQWAHEGPDVVADACLNAAKEHAADRLADDALVVALRRA